MSESWLIFSPFTQKTQTIECLSCAKSKKAGSDPSYSCLFVCIEDMVSRPTFVLLLSPLNKRQPVSLPISLSLSLSLKSLTFPAEFILLFVLELRSLYLWSFLSPVVLFSFQHRRFSLSSRRFSFSSRRFSMSSRCFSMSSRRFYLSSRCFSLSNNYRCFSLSTGCFSLSTGCFSLSARCLNFSFSSRCFSLSSMGAIFFICSRCFCLCVK